MKNDTVEPSHERIPKIRRFRGRGSQQVVVFRVEIPTHLPYGRKLDLGQNDGLGER